MMTRRYCHLTCTCVQRWHVFTHAGDVKELGILAELPTIQSEILLTLSPAEASMQHADSEIGTLPAEAMLETLAAPQDPVVSAITYLMGRETELMLPEAALGQGPVSRLSMQRTVGMAQQANQLDKHLSLAAKSRRPPQIDLTLFNGLGMPEVRTRAINALVYHLYDRGLIRQSHVVSAALSAYQALLSTTTDTVALACMHLYAVLLTFAA